MRRLRRALPMEASMSDLFANHANTVTAPSRNPYPVTPHDSQALPLVPKALYVGRGGTLVVRGIDSAADAVFENVPDGGQIEVRALYVRATGTSAGAIVALA